jgi:acetyl/propionyl-CoA carboxylase alpha subunit
MSILGLLFVAHVSNAGKDSGIDVVALGDGRFLVSDGSSTRLAYAVASGRERWVFLDGRVFLVGSSAAARTRASSTDHADALAAPMPATVVRIEVAPGETVARDTLLVMLEAMKMELPIRAPRDGRVSAIHCRVGEIVQPGVPLLEIS